MYTKFSSVIKGNKIFRRLVLEHKEAYSNATRTVKPRVARKVVKIMRKHTPPARFLRKDGKFWFEVGDIHASEKTCQALREKPYALKAAEYAEKKATAEDIEEIINTYETEKADEKQQSIKKTKKSEKVDEMNAGATPTTSFPSLPPSYPGVIAPPFAYYPMHSSASGYPPPPPYYGMPHPTAVPLVKKVEGGEEVTQIAGNDNSKGEQDKASKQPSPEISKTLDKLLDSSSEQENPNYSVKGGLFGEMDENGDIIVTDRDVLCGRGGLTNHHKV